MLKHVQIHAGTTDKFRENYGGSVPVELTTHTCLFIKQTSQTVQVVVHVTGNEV
jgi:hypothetical protein